MWNLWLLIGTIPEVSITVNNTYASVIAVLTKNKNETAVKANTLALGTDHTVRRKDLIGTSARFSM